MRHELKCWPHIFQAIIDGACTAMPRLDDRKYKVGDTIWLREWERAPDTAACQKCGEYTSRCLHLEITHIIRGNHSGELACGVEEGHCVLSFRKL